jgi:mannose-6-phosphate isomerase-like protein (cupin superfamily)
MRWFGVKKEKNDAELEIDRLSTQIAARIKISARFKNISVDFNFPERFAELTNDLCTGHIEWRKYRADAAKGILSADNKWVGKSSITTHCHQCSDETIQSVHGEGIITIYDEKGLMVAKVRLKEGESYTIPAGVNHFVQSLNDWDMIVKYKRVK